MKVQEQYEINEAEIAKSLMELFKIKEFNIYCNNVDYAPIDMEFDHQSGKKYIAEIKCRQEMKLGMMIEQKKLIELINSAKKGIEARYINYVESTDQLIIYDINSRWNLEFLKIWEFPEYPAYYEKIKAQKSEANKERKYKNVMYLYYNHFQTKDYVIDNFSKTLENNNIQFNYKKITR
jgi:hypothetical protein